MIKKGYKARRCCTYGSLVVAILLCFNYNSSAQTPDIILGTYSNQAEIAAARSITLTNGFYVPAGKSLRVYVGQACSPLGSTPSGNQNYISIKVFKVPGVTIENVDLSRSICEVNQTVQYFDGLGRALQTVQVKASPLEKDIIVPVEYDAFGRESTRYEPYADPGLADGSYRPSAITSQLNFYQSITGSIRKSSYPFSKTVFEASSLNRVLEQGAPGNIYQPGQRVTAGGHTIVNEYLVNDASDVRKLIVTSLGISAAGTYDVGTLYKTIIKDENWTSGKLNTTEEFKDMEGKVLMKRAWLTSAVSLNTYYVYDDFGNLRYVVPPYPGSTSLTTLNETDDIFRRYCYGYHYDERNRLIDKKIPGRDWEYSVYNILDQIVLTQDAKQRSDKKWAFTKYDAFGRTIQTGLMTSTLGADSLRKLVKKQAVLWETWVKNSNTYTSAAFPQVFTDSYTMMFYDDYKYPMPDLYKPVVGASNKTKGLLTQTVTYVIGSTNYMLGVNHYDDYGRLIKAFKQHYVSSTRDSLNYDEINNVYNFSGDLTSSTRIHHKRGAANTVVAMEYDYDAWGRKLRTRQKINGDNQVLLSENLYNEIGGLEEKRLHNGLQKTQFTYIERGWLLTKTSNEFSEVLKYVDSAANRQYNGNIPFQKWGYSKATPNVFAYTYDGLNRLTKATTNTGTPLNETITYDSMGNIDSLNRNGVGGRYVNSGNKLMKINGGLGTSTYVYDDNGNMITDGRNNATIVYNMLSLPEFISKTGLTVNYLYAADGTKLQKTSNATGTLSTTNYINGIQYTDGSIDFIQTEEGIARRNKGTDDKGVTYSYEYNLTDHLGNVRLTFNENPSTHSLAVLQKDDYFAFGKRSSLQAGPNKYLYNGKELQEELEEYDYGARFYDPVVGRWTTMDPLAELAPDLTPFRYCFNNPIGFVDPYGLWERNATGYSTDKKEDIERFLDMLQIENHSLKNNPNISQLSNFVDGEMKIGGLGTLSDGSKLAKGFTINQESDIYGGKHWVTDRKSYSNFWHSVQGDLTPHALDPRTLGQNLLGTTYAGGDNPKKYNGKDDYSYNPSNPVEQIAIRHDLAYNKLGISGLNGLVNDQRAIKADYTFVLQNFAVALDPFQSALTRIRAFLLGQGLGLIALPKTVESVLPTRVNAPSRK